MTSDQKQNNNKDKIMYNTNNKEQQSQHVYHHQASNHPPMWAQPLATLLGASVISIITSMIVMYTNQSTQDLDIKYLQKKVGKHEENKEDIHKLQIEFEYLQADVKKMKKVYTSSSEKNKEKLDSLRNQALDLERTITQLYNRINK